MSRKDDLISDLQELAASEKKAGDHRKATKPDDPNKTGSVSKLIAIENDEVRAWAARLGCSEQELREAMETVGNSAEEVRRFLSNRRR